MATRFNDVMFVNDNDNNRCGLVQLEVGPRDVATDAGGSWRGWLGPALNQDCLCCLREEHLDVTDDNLNHLEKTCQKLQIHQQTD